MCLLDRGVAGAKPELVIRNEEGEFHIRTEALQEESLEDLRRNREEANSVSVLSLILLDTAISFIL